MNFCHSSIGSVRFSRSYHSIIQSSSNQFASNSISAHQLSSFLSVIDIDIIKSSEYAPVTVKLDASKSRVKDSDIAKFIWDYGDGITEERDSIVPGHKYSVAWDYDIMLTVVTSDWKEFSTSKKLILKPATPTAKIVTSLKSAPVWQTIDFSSEGSSWQVIWYFWDFWDWETSLWANPSHSYDKPWSYTVKLRLDFANKNVLEDSLEIEGYEE